MAAIFIFRRLTILRLRTMKRSIKWLLCQAQEEGGLPQEKKGSPIKLGLFRLFHCHLPLRGEGRDLELHTRVNSCLSAKVYYPCAWGTGAQIFLPSDWFIPFMVHKTPM